jgi:hypothetical protein
VWIWASHVSFARSLGIWVNLYQPWNEIDRENRRTRGETCCIAFLCKNPTWTEQCANQDLRDEMRTANRLSYGMAYTLSILEHKQCTVHHKVPVFINSHSCLILRQLWNWWKSPCKYKNSNPQSLISCKVTDTNVGKWRTYTHAHTHTHTHTRRLRHAWSDRILYTVSLWRWLADESTWQ